MNVLQMVSIIINDFGYTYQSEKMEIMKQIDKDFYMLSASKTAVNFRR